MISSKKGSVGMWVLIVVILLAVIIGVWFWNLRDNVSSVSSTKTNMSLQSSSTGQKGINCGILSTESLLKSLPSSEEQQKLLCLSKALASCDSASLTFEGDKDFSWSVLGKTENRCQTRFYNIFKAKEIDCEISFSSIGLITGEAKKNKQEWNAFSQLILLSAMKPPIITLTGEEIDLTCLEIQEESDNDISEPVGIETKEEQETTVSPNQPNSADELQGVCTLMGKNSDTDYVFLYGLSIEGGNSIRINSSKCIYNLDKSVGDTTMRQFLNNDICMIFRERLCDNSQVCTGEAIENVQVSLEFGDIIRTSNLDSANTTTLLSYTLNCARV